MRVDFTMVLRALLVCALIAPFADCEENVFSYRTDALYRVDPKLISHVECASWHASVPLPAFLAVRPDGGTVVVAGGRMGAILDTNGAVQSRFDWEGPVATAVAAAPDGQIFVGAGNRVMAGIPSKPLRSWALPEKDALITGIAADSNQVWVCDFTSRMVWRFDFEGLELGQLPPPGAPREEAFIVPSPSFAVATANDGTFWVVNTGRCELQRRAADGHLLEKWTRPGMTTPGFCGCCNPAFLALMPNGDLVTSEKHIPRVKIYGPDGAFRSVVAPPALLSGDDGRPVAVDRSGRVLVLDGKSIRRFACKPEKSP